MVLTCLQRPAKGDQNIIIRRWSLWTGLWVAYLLSRGSKIVCTYREIQWQLIATWTIPPRYAMLSNDIYLTLSGSPLFMLTLLPFSLGLAQRHWQKKICEERNKYVSLICLCALDEFPSDLQEVLFFFFCLYSLETLTQTPKSPTNR